MRKNVSLILVLVGAFTSDGSSQCAPRAGYLEGLRTSPLVSAKRLARGACADREVATKLRLTRSELSRMESAFDHDDLRAAKSQEARLRAAGGRATSPVVLPPTATRA